MDECSSLKRALAGSYVTVNFRFFFFFFSCMDLVFSFFCSLWEVNSKVYCGRAISIGALSWIRRRSTAAMLFWLNRVKKVRERKEGARERRERRENVTWMIEFIALFALFALFVPVGLISSLLGFGEVYEEARLLSRQTEGTHCRSRPGLEKPCEAKGPTGGRNPCDCQNLLISSCIHTYILWTHARPKSQVWRRWNAMRTERLASWLKLHFVVQVVLLLNLMTYFHVFCSVLFFPCCFLWSNSVSRENKQNRRRWCRVDGWKRKESKTRGA